MVRVKGLEPPWGEPHTDLNRTRLPIPPHPHHSKTSVVNITSGNTLMQEKTLAFSKVCAFRVTDLTRQEKKRDRACTTVNFARKVDGCARGRGTHEGVTG